MSTPTPGPDDERPDPSGTPDDAAADRGAAHDGEAPTDAPAAAGPDEDPAPGPDEDPAPGPQRQPGEPSASGGHHAAPRQAPPSGRAAPADVVVDDLRTGPTASLPAEGSRPGATGSLATGTAGPAAPGGAGAPAAGDPDPTAGTTRPVPASAPAAPPRGTDDDRPAEDRPARRRDRRPRTGHEDLPEVPPKPGVGRHVLGALVGLALTPFAFLLTGIGAARLAEIAGTTRMGTDALGTTLLVIGVLLLAALVLLGAWSPAVPITGGLVWGLALGAAYLAVPDVVEDVVDQAAQGRTPPAAVDQFAQSAMSGTLLLVGVLLLTAGIAAGIARRAGRRWAEQAAAAELARIEADHAARTAGRGPA